MKHILEAALRQFIRRGRILTSPAQLAGYDADGLGYKTFRPDAVVIPADADELIALMKGAVDLNVPVTIRGAGTSLSGGPVAAQGGVVVHTSALKKVRTISQDGFWCEVESSVTLNQLDAALKPHGMFYPPDPSSGPVCTLGGNVAMNAGGAHCFRYGVTSNYVLGLEAVLLDGSVHCFGGPAGGRGAWREDWKRLMVGSEGTLAAFTRFWLRTLPRAEKAWTFRATFPDLQSAERAIHALVAHSSFPVAIELMDPRCVAMVENSPMACGLAKNVFLLVTEIEGPAVLVDARVSSVVELLTTAGSASVECSDDEVQRGKLWKARKVAGGLMGQLSPDFLVQDAVIPKRALAEVLQLVYDEADAAGLPAVNVFHAGDGNLHPNFMFDSAKPGELEKVEAISKRLMQRVVEVGGTLSGEHGIGNDKTAYMSLVFGVETLKLQLAIPAVFNSRHQLNPLKVFNGRKFAGAAESMSRTAGRSVETASSLTDESRCSQDIRARLFEPFLDQIDGVVCVAAEVTGAQLSAMLASHRLRFPLMADLDSSLLDQLVASEYSPASSRFGPYCDNISGMNWQLPSGHVVRIGERVVKSTTGYDLLRFLLAADAREGRFGRPIDLVLRLRSDSGVHGRFDLCGDFESVRQAVADLMQSCWMNWFDSVDAAESTEDSLWKIRIVVNTTAEEWPVFETMLTDFAGSHRLALSTAPKSGPAMDGCPDFALKTTPDRSLELARYVGTLSELTCVVLCYNGVVHGYLKNRDSVGQQIRSVMRQVEHQLHEVGGNWNSRHVSCDEYSVLEAEWVKILIKEFST